MNETDVSTEGPRKRGHSRAASRWAIVALAAAAILTGCAAQVDAPAELGEPMVSGPGDNCTGGFIGEWNSTPDGGDVSALPQRTVTVVAETGRIFDASRRTSDGTAESVPSEELGDLDYKVKVDPSWPKGHAVVIDTDTDKVLDTIKIPDDAPLCDAETE